MDPAKPPPSFEFESEEHLAADPPRLSATEMALARQMLGVEPAKRRIFTLKAGEQATIRLLPGPSGDGRTFWRRIGMHWTARQKPLYCPRETPGELGGGPSASCPACEAAEAHEKSREMKLASRLRVKWRMFVWCIVRPAEALERTTAHAPLLSRFDVYEFWMPADLFNYLIDVLKAGQDPISPAAAHDFIVSRDQDGRWRMTVQPDATPMVAGASPDASTGEFQKLKEWMLEPPISLAAPERLAELVAEIEAEERAPRRGASDEFITEAPSETVEAAAATATKGATAVEEVEEDALPTVYVPGGGVTITQFGAAIFGLAAEKLELFLRGGGVAEVIKDQETGVLKADILKPAAARSRCEEYARLVRITTDRNGNPKLKPAVLSEEDARALLDCRGKERLPVLRSLVNCPVLTGQGDCLRTLGCGYDSQTGIWVRGNDAEQVELEEAVRSVKDVLGEFAFATPSDRARAMAQVFTPALVMGKILAGRPALNITEANESQTGKGYLARLVAAFYSEVYSTITKRRGGVGSFDEGFDSALVSARPMILLDNVRGPINSQKLESFLTEPSYQARVPYRDWVHIDPTRFILYLTSNGVELTDDMAFRSSFCRLRKRPGYHYKKYPEGDLLAHVRAHQPYYLGCIFAIIKEWWNRGRPTTEEVRHDFRPWVQTLDYIVQHICGMAPLMDGHEECQDRASAPFLSFLRQLAIAVDKDKRLEQTMRATDILGIAMERGIDIPGLNLNRVLDDQAGAQAIGMVMGRVFKDDSRRRVDEYVVQRFELDRNEETHHATKAYTFSKTALA